MKPFAPVTLQGYGVGLEPLGDEHATGLGEAAADGRLWELWFSRVPSPDEAAHYIAEALEGQRKGNMLAWAVCDGKSGRVLGSTRYHDILTDVDRVEIGYTWYALSVQRTSVNPACKLLLMQHAFETLGCAVVGFRTDPYNFRSQRAIEHLGAKLDGVIRHYQLRRDGTVRDSVMYSMLREEWPDAKRNLLVRLQRLRIC